MNRPTLVLLALLITTTTQGASIIPQFNPANGTLTDVTISVNGFASQVYTAATPLPGLPTPPPLASSYSYTEIIDVFVGSSLIYEFHTAGTATPQGSHVVVGGSFSFAAVENNPANLAKYIGTGTLTVTVGVSFSLHPFDGSVERDGTTPTTSFAQIHYSALAPGTVPTPSGGLLGLLALALTVGFFSQRKTPLA